MATKNKTKTMVMTAILTALVIILQYLSLVVKISSVPITLVLVPVVIGAAYCGAGTGAWLGFIFGFSVLISGGSEPFFTINPLGTILTVLIKGTACGFFAGLTYKALEKFNRHLAVILSAIVCPMVNTGIFFLGCLAFFMPTVTQWAEAAGLGENVALYMFVGLAGINFLVELGINIILNPIILRLLNYIKNA